MVKQEKGFLTALPVKNSSIRLSENEPLTKCKDFKSVIHLQ